MENLFISKESPFFSQNKNNKALFSGIFSSKDNNKSPDIFSNINSLANNNQEDDEHCCEVLNDEKIELSQIKELENESVSGTESAFKSRNNSQLNLKTNYNLNEDKKEDEFLKPHDVNINNNKNEQISITNNNFINTNLNNNNNNYNQLDFEDEVNKKYGLFPII